MAENKDIEKAVTALAANQAKYEKATAYYNGEHSLKFATDKFRNAFGTLFKEFALNLCPAVCDAVRDKLTVTGWKVEAGSDTVTKKAWEIWQANRMGVRARQIHREAIVAGDAYAIVWVDPDKKTTIYPQKAMSCTVIYNVETPGKIDMAAKYWLIDGTKKDKKKARLNLYYADRIERYVTVKDLQGTTLPSKATDWVEFADDGGAFEIKNPYKRVPVFHFANNADIGSFGKSEISQAIPVQDALNKSVLDMLIAMEFSAFRQRWATGVEIEEDADGNAKPPFIAGAERLWVTENTETKFGDFAASDIKQFLEVKDGFRMDLAAVTGTPLHYFMQIGSSFPSGESLRKAETRFINKVNDRQESFGQVWEDVMQFALMIENESIDARLFTEWEDPAPLSEKEMLDNIALKVDLGISEEQALIEAGYGEADIKKMMEANAKKAQDAVDRFNAGEDLGGEGDDVA